MDAVSTLLKENRELKARLQESDARVQELEEELSKALIEFDTLQEQMHSLEYD